MFSFLVGGMLPLPRHASRGALLLGRAAVPPRLVGPWLCASGTAEAAAPTCPLPDGILVVHKPQNWTSFDVVAKVRNTLQDHLRGHGHKFTGRKKLKVGHGGTLDPMATGLLVIGVGKGCRALEGYLKGAKSYAAVAQLGSETDSQDAEGSVIKHAPYEHVTEDALREAAVALTGDILQRPPIFSAIKRDGKRMYDLARKGEVTEEEMVPRKVTVHELRVSGLDPATGTFALHVRCGGGTYVRTLIVDLARAVGSGAHMSALERTHNGPFHVCVDGAPPLSEARKVRPVTQPEFSDVPRLYEAMGEAEQVLKALEEDRDDDGEDDGAP